MKCDECNLDMKWFDDFPDACGCCGTDYYKCPPMWGSKNKKLWLKFKDKNDKRI